MNGRRLNAWAFAAACLWRRAQIRRRTRLAPSFAGRHYTVGMSYAISRRLALSLYAAYSPNRKLDGSSSVPLVVNAGPGGLIPLPIGGGEFDLRADQKQGGGSLAWKF